jgi:putative hydrolase of the HAD superfamily
MPHRAILFDLGRVLVHFDFRRGYRTLEGLCPYPAEEIPKRLSATGLVERFETGLIEPRDFVKRICEVLQLPIGYDEFSTVWSSIFTDVLIPEEMLEALARHYRLVLISNTNAIHFEMIRAAYGNLLRHFHSLVVSYEVKAMKPDEAIFRAAVDRADCQPAECFYTDDIRAYVDAARRLGIDGVVFESKEQIAREMRARGMVW